MEKLWKMIFTVLLEKRYTDIEKVVKINQKDHAQGHICPKVEDWLRYGPSGLAEISEDKLRTASDEKKFFMKVSSITLNAAC